MGSSDVPLASGPSGSTDSGDRFRGSVHPLLPSLSTRLSQHGGRDGIGSPGPPSPSLATQMASGRAPVEIPGDDVVTCLPVTWERIGVLLTGRPGLLPDPALEEGQPTQTPQSGFPTGKRGCVARRSQTDAEQAKQQMSATLRPGKAVCRAVCTGQTVIENYLLIRTESKHCPRIPLDKQIQL